jgi:hypothetical protein
LEFWTELTWRGFAIKRETKIGKKRDMIEEPVEPAGENSGAACITSTHHQISLAFKPV